MADKSIHKIIDHLFRQSYGKMVGILVSKYGIGQLDLIENGVMEAYLKALKIWPFKGMPDNPKAWLYTVSNRSVLDAFRKKHNKNISFDSVERLMVNEDDWVNMDEKIKDPELQLLFKICHPDLNRYDQLAFMLKTISGFGIKEIAGALLVNDETIKKRLSRARTKIIKEKMSFEWSDVIDYRDRLDAVNQVIYLLFTEGFYSTHPEQQMRKDLCVEATRLGKYLCDGHMGDVDSHAIMSIMCFHSARFLSRLDKDNDLVLLKDQDRTLWNSFLIQRGLDYLTESTQMSDDKSVYQIEAYILSVHCLSESYNATDWRQLDVLYTHLFRRKPQALIRLNMILVKIQLGDLEMAVSMFEELKLKEIKPHKLFYYKVGAELYGKLNNKFKAKILLEKALNLAHEKKESQFLIEKLNDLNQMN